MKKRRAEAKFSPAIPDSTRDAYVQSIVGEAVEAARPPEPLTEFGGPEFSIEPVKGARAFEVDKLGRLRGVTFSQVWTPGENEATCRAGETGGGGYSFGTGITYYLYGASIGGSIPAAPTRPNSNTPHGLVRCKCGFYGYYDGSNDYHEPKRVSGVVEARANAAAEGPWSVSHDREDVHFDTCVTIGDFGWVAYGPQGQGPHYDEDTPQGRDDAEFIAHSRQDVPALVAALRAVLDLLDERDEETAEVYGESEVAVSSLVTTHEVRAAITAHLDPS